MRPQQRAQGSADTLGHDVWQERRYRVLAHMSEEALDAGIEVQGAKAETTAPGEIRIRQERGEEQQRRWLR